MATKTKKSPLEKEDPAKELEQTIAKMLELKVEVPSIEATLEGANQALAQAQMATKQKRLKNHHCTECGDSGIQLYLGGNGSGHFDCYIDEEGLYCDEHGEPFTDPKKIETLKIVNGKGGRGHL